jgi:hypothetical protein
MESVSKKRQQLNVEPVLVDMEQAVISTFFPSVGQSTLAWAITYGYQQSVTTEEPGRFQPEGVFRRSTLLFAVPWIQS